MHMNEDSEILARLGILTSNEQSPRKEGNLKYAQASTKFVDVNISGDANTEDDSEDDIFDRDTLLLGNQSGRERVATNSRRHSDTPVCRFILLLLSFYIAGLTLHSTPDIYLLSMRTEGHVLPILQMGGLVIGALIARTYVPRFNSMWLLFACICVLTTLTVILLSPQDSTSLHIIVITQGICVATIKYAGLSTWFMWWRSSHRKFFWILFACALGATIPTLLRSPMTDDWHPTTEGPIQHPHQMHRRAIDNLRNANLMINNLPKDMKPTSDNSGLTENKPKKPDVAFGTNESNSRKAEQNSRLREAANSDLSGVQVDLTTAITTTTVTTTTTPIVTTEPVALVQTSTLKPEGKVKGGMVAKGVEKIDKIDKAIGTKIQDMQSAVLFRVADLSVEWFVVVVLGTVLLLYLFSFFACCLSWAVIADSRVAKLSDHTSPGLSAGCRMRVCACHCLAAALNYAMMYSAMEQGSSYEILAAVCMALVMFIAAIIGGACCTSSASWLFVFLTLIGSIILKISPSSYLGFLLTTASAPMISCSLVMRIEKNVGARPSQNIDMFLLCNFGTKLVLSIWCYLVGRFKESSLMSFALFGSILLIPMLYLAGVSMKRAARLKEICEYTSSNGGEPRDVTRIGNYTMLEVPSDDTDEESNI
ncbi:unnamed protein product, partial [Mesorhabditis belari]|uniref:Uncharacterized protein n=1 Tax=Mesorhabditis belari TaxID=2138241 RepID=A0AAF3FC78_9BILA